MEEGVVQNTKAVISLETGQVRVKITIECLYKNYIRGTDFCQKMYDLE